MKVRGMGGASVTWLPLDEDELLILEPGRAKERSDFIPEAGYGAG